MLKTITELDETYDKHKKKYIESFLEYMKFLNDKNRSTYIVKRKEKLKDNILKLK